YTVEATGSCGTLSSSASLTIDSASRITNLSLSGPNVVITFASLSGRFYRLQYTDNLASGQWLTAADNILGTGGLVQAAHVGGAGRPSRFYRLKLLSNAELA